MPEPTSDAMAPTFPQEPPAAEAAAQGQIRVLIVDDDPVMREMLADVFEAPRYLADTAASGEEAFEKLQHGAFDLLLTDMRMPGYDGFDVLAAAHRIAPDTEVIVMTGYASVDMAVECMKRGATDFITKPFNIDHILMIAQRVVEGKRLRERAAQTEYYQSLALTDALTGIYNRRYFMQLLETEMARSKRKGHAFVVAMLDIDNFKSFNDTNGHLAGDDALKKVAWALDHHSRTSDIVARFGGEEFALILPEMTRNDGRLAAERLRRIIEQTPVPGEKNTVGGRLTISLGLAVFPDDADAVTQLLERADRALYLAKGRGKNQVRSWDEVPA